MRKKLPLTFLCLLFGAAVLAGCQQAQPTPQVQVDLTSPVMAAQTFMSALAAGDQAGAQAACSAGAASDVAEWFTEESFVKMMGHMQFNVNTSTTDGTDPSATACVAVSITADDYDWLIEQADANGNYSQQLMDVIDSYPQEPTDQQLQEMNRRLEEISENMQKEVNRYIEEGQAPRKTYIVNLYFAYNPTAPGWVLNRNEDLVDLLLDREVLEYDDIF